jgi:hypothetical protein
MGSIMPIEHMAPVEKKEFASVFVALELSRSKWAVGVGAPQKWTVRRHEVQGGDLDGLLKLLSRISAGEERRSGFPVEIHVCFEAGRDSHWLKAAGYAVYKIESAQVSVDRRARRAKSDGVDVDKLYRPGESFEERVRRLQGRRGPERSGRRREASAPRVRAAGHEQISHRNRGEVLAVRPRHPRRSNTAWSAPARSRVNSRG